MNNRETAAAFFGFEGLTRYWRSGSRARQPPAPAPGRRALSAPLRAGLPPARSCLPQSRRHRIYASLRHQPTAETTKAPDCPGPLMLVRARLLQRGIDRGELGIQAGAEAVDDGDDRERNAGGNQTVFDGGGAGLILHETRNQVLHRGLHVDTWLVELTFGLAGVLSTVTMAHPKVGNLRHS